MIVLVQISPRRYIAIDAPKRESTWTTIATRGYAEHHDVGVIYGRGDLIAGPADYETCQTAMAKVAAERDALMPYTEWERLQKERAEALVAANIELQARRTAGK